MVTWLVLAAATGTAKVHFGLGVAAVSGYRDGGWESGGDISMDLSTNTLDLRLRAPLYFTMAKHPVLDGYDWDSRSDYGRILDRLYVHTDKKRISLYAGPLRSITLGMGEMVEGYYNYLCHRSAKAGFVLHGDVDYIGADVALSDVLDTPDLIAAQAFFRPLYSLGGQWKHLRLEAALVAARQETLVIRYGFGLHVPVYANKAFGAGLEVFLRKGIYTLGVFARWKSKNTTGKVQAGLRLSRHQINTSWAGPFFSVEQQDFWGLGTHRAAVDDYVLEKTGVAAAFLRFKLKVSHVLDLWMIVDVDTVQTALYAGGFALTVGPIRAGMNAAARGRGHWMFGSEVKWLFYGPVYLTLSGGRTYDYTAGKRSKVMVITGGIGAILQW